MRNSTAVNCKVLDLNDLVSFPLQPDYFDELSGDDVQRLADNIRRNGLRQLIEVLGKNKAGYKVNTILKGHQRRRALLLLGKTKSPVMVREDLADADTNEIEREFLEDNQHRRQLDPLAKARVALRLYEIEKGRVRSKFGLREEGEVRDHVGNIIGMSGRNLARYVNILLRTPVEVQNAFRGKRISLVAASAVACFSTADKGKVAKRIAAGEDPAQVLAEFLPHKDGRHRSVNDALAGFHRTLRQGLEDLDGRVDKVTSSQVEAYRIDLEQAVKVLSSLLAKVKKR